MNLIIKLITVHIAAQFRPERDACRNKVVCFELFGEVDLKNERVSRQTVEETGIHYKVILVKQDNLCIKIGKGCRCPVHFFNYDLQGINCAEWKDHIPIWVVVPGGL